MRKINFRVWYKPEQRFLDPWAEEDPIFNLKEYTDCKWGVGVAIYDRDKMGWEYLKEDDIVIQQGTGVLDSKGVEIYEGDMVYRYDSLLEVRWAEAYSGYQFCLVDEDGDTDFYGGLGNTDYAEIVGHIYGTTSKG